MSAFLFLTLLSRLFRHCRKKKQHYHGISTNRLPRLTWHRSSSAPAAGFSRLRPSHFPNTFSTSPSHPRSICTLHHSTWLSTTRPLARPVDHHSSPHTRAGGWRRRPHRWLCEPRSQALRPRAREAVVSMPRTTAQPGDLWRAALASAGPGWPTCALQSAITAEWPKKLAGAAVPGERHAPDMTLHLWTNRGHLTDLSQAAGAVSFFCPFFRSPPDRPAAETPIPFPSPVSAPTTCCPEPLRRELRPPFPSLACGLRADSMLLRDHTVAN